MEIIIFIFVCYVILFLLSIKLKDNSIVDVFWGIGFIIIAVFLFIYEKSFSFEQVLALLLIFFWGIRLSGYIFVRKLSKKGEDPRYAEWRKQWKNFYLRSFFQVYLLQMVLMFLVSTPIYFIFTSKFIHPILFIIGFVIALFGLLFEIIADYQVRKFFKHSQLTHVLFTGGLYKYSRNPNYFGESIFWLGLSIIGMSNSWWSLIGFFSITYLLVFVSGVPLKEERQSKKEGWDTYMKHTNKFFPWFPKK